MRLRWPDPPLPDALRDALMGPGARFELVEADVLGTPLEVFAQRPTDLRRLLIDAGERFGDRPYTVFPDRSLTFASMRDPVAAVARGLSEQFGVGPGDRVAIAAANTVEWVLTFWAATALGAITVAMNGWWTGPEMTYALELTTPKVLLGDRRRLERLAGATVGCPIVVFEDDFDALEAAGAGAALPDQPIAEDDPFLVLFTSGTTGRPKGAVLSHRSNIHFMLSAMLRSAEQIGRAMIAGEEVAPPPERPCTISASPLFHVSGLNCQLAFSTLTGVTIVYQPPGKWREDVHLELSERHRATVWSLVPTQLWRLLEWPDLERYDLSALQTIGGGSAVWPPELLRALERRLPWVRPRMGLGYGMTETNGAGTSLGAAGTYAHPESVGQPAPGVEVEIRDPATGEPLGAGEVGEICLRTAAGFLCYWDDPDATRAVLDPDRWYRTGDHGHVRDGYVYLEGRRQDLVIRGGENIYPAEIESRLIEHPDIVEVAVTGVDHPTLGQEVKAYVVARPGSMVTDDDVRNFAAATLAGFKVPAHVEFIDSLPHNASGKVLKHLLGRPADDADVAGFVADE
jgi:acyl-CoA synthetase (AMP-forming)/AMP-acid ligase II